MKTIMPKRQNPLASYLTITIGVGCVTSVAEGAVVFYGVNAANDINPDPTGIALDEFRGYRGVDTNQSTHSFFAYSYISGNYFTQGIDLAGDVRDNLRFREATYTSGANLGYGATLGSANYAMVSFDGDNVHEAIAQFFFDGAGNGYLIAIATTNPITDPSDLSGVGGSTLSISAGKAMIDAAAIPEPSGLSLLGLGTVGLAARRQRRRMKRRMV